MHKMTPLLTGMIFALLLVPQAAMAAKRIALVVGNDEYAQVTNLKKAVNDARAIGATLEKIGYEVIVAENVTRREMNRQLQHFASKIDVGDEALFFFAGHGVEIAGRNYLLPTDIPSAAPGQEDFVTTEAIAVDRVLDRIRSRGTRVSILVLDACRDNPFPKAGTRSLGSTRGLARTAAPEGTFIMYSAGVGQTALDRLDNADPDPNSVFTRSLIPLLKTPGMSLTRTAREVRRNVQKLASTVSHDQRPAYYDEVTGDFFFAGEAQAVPDDTEEADKLAALQQRLRDLEEQFQKQKDAPKSSERKTDTAHLQPPSTGGARVTRAPVTECDRLASNETIPGSVLPSVILELVDKPAAVKACETASERYPEDSRFPLQLAHLHLVAEDYDKALGIFRKYAEQGNPGAQNALGNAYLNGNGVPTDEKISLAWFRKAAAQDHAVAQYNIATQHLLGLGIEKDLAEGAVWLRRSAENGFAEAANYLGYMYRVGEGVPKDDSESQRWYRVAANNWIDQIEKGSLPAKNNLAILVMNGFGVQKDQDKAAELLLDAYGSGVPVTKRILGETQTKMIPDETWYAIKKKLKSRGFYRGPIDSEVGKETSRALHAFAEVTGKAKAQASQ